MADDTKRDEPVTIKLTEQVLLDLNRVAASQERSMSEYLYLVIRKHLREHGAGRRPAPANSIVIPCKPEG